MIAPTGDQGRRTSGLYRRHSDAPALLWGRQLYVVRRVGSRDGIGDEGLTERPASGANLSGRVRRRDPAPPPLPRGVGRRAIASDRNRGEAIVPAARGHVIQMSPIQ